MTFSVSIILCTRDRADSLRDTLASITSCAVPDDLSVELLVIDNGSVDHTRQVVEAATAGAKRLEVRYVWSPRPGKSHALNAGMSRSRGDVLLFTDDDVRASGNWIDAMCRPIVEGRADAVVGARMIAAHLRRDWMERVHYDSLACSEGRIEADLVGSNMAFARHVLARVPQFDPEIGPPISAGGEDTLFSRQLTKAGFRIVSLPEARVEHHFDPSRLGRDKMLDAALKGAVNDFYIGYHWMHIDLPLARWAWVGCWLRLWYRRLRHWRAWRRHPSMPAWERVLIQHAAALRLYARHRGEPRRYAKFGLVKCSGAVSDTAAAAAAVELPSDPTTELVAAHGGEER